MEEVNQQTAAPQFTPEQISHQKTLLIASLKGLYGNLMTELNKYPCHPQGKLIAINHVNEAFIAYEWGISNLHPSDPGFIAAPTPPTAPASEPTTVIAESVTSMDEMEVEAA